MDEITMLAGLVESQYGAQGVSFHPLNSENGKRIYRVNQATGPDWVLRAYPLVDDGNDAFALATILQGSLHMH